MAAADKPNIMPPEVYPHPRETDPRRYVRELEASQMEQLATPGRYDDHTHVFRTNRRLEPEGRCGVCGRAMEEIWAEGYRHLGPPPPPEPQEHQEPQEPWGQEALF